MTPQKPLQAVKKQPVAFQATLPEIKQALEEKQAKLCPGKTIFISQIAKFLEGIQQKMAQNQQAGAPKKLDFMLGEMNVLPESISKLEIKGQTLEQLDAKLNEGSFSCGPKSDCTCGKGQTLGEFLSQVILAKILKVPNPEKIELDIKNA